MTKILLVEDDTQISKSLSIGLNYGGFEVASVGTIHEAWASISQTAFDVLLLDVNLPDGSGIELCQRLRSVGKTTPVLFLSARTDEETVVKGITVGADDYIRKPFGIEELKARIKKTLNRGQSSGSVVQAGPLEVDTERRVAVVAGRPLVLGRREFDILAILVKKGGDVVPRESIISALDEKSELYDRTIDSHISHLRRKIREAGGQALQIVSIYGIGYRLDWDKE